MNRRSDVFMSWLKGKKTIIAGVVVCAFATMAVLYGLISVEQGGILFGFGMAIAGWADKANRHHAEIMTALTEVAKIGADLKSRQPVAGDLKAGVSDLKPYSGPLAGELAARGTQLHINADSPGELLSALETFAKGLKA